MLATRLRESPCNARLRRSSSGRCTSSAPSSARSTVIGATTVWLRLPLGPFTVTERPSIATSPPEGTVTGCFPMRDMPVPPSSPDVGEDFPAHALLGGLPVSQQTCRRRNDRNTESAQHLRQAGGLGVDPQARLGHAPHASDAALAVRPELQLNDQVLALLTLLSAVPGDVALALQDGGDVRLDLGVRHHDLVVKCRVGSAQTSEHVCDRVSHRHVTTSTFLAPVPSAGLWRSGSQQGGACPYCEPAGSSPTGLAPAGPYGQV